MAIKYPDTGGSLPAELVTVPPIELPVYDTKAQAASPYLLYKGNIPDDDCGCKTTDYCMPVQPNDSFTLQIDPDFLVGTTTDIDFMGRYGYLLCGDDLLENVCLTITEGGSCSSTVTVNSGVTDTYPGETLCLSATSSSVKKLISVPGTSLTAGKKYVVKFCITDYVSGTMNIRVNGTTPSLVSDIEGNGCYWGEVEITADDSYTFELWGRNPDDDHVISFCISHIALYEVKAFTEVTLVDAADIDNEIHTFDDDAVSITTYGNVQVNFKWNTDIPYGCYRVKMVHQCTEVALYTSCFNFQASHPCTYQLAWRNDENAFGIDYSDLNYYHYARVRARIKEPAWEIEKNIHTYSNNDIVTTYGRANKNWRLTIEDIPDYLHEAIAVGTLHDNFYIDGKIVVVKDGDYKPDWRKSSQLAPVTIEVLERNYNNINSFC